MQSHLTKSALFLLLLLHSTSTTLLAQADSATVAAGPEYRAGEVQRWLLGDAYRDLWTTPLEIPVLDLENVGGGLVPVRRGGSVQTIALRFQAANGDEYNFRSIDKELTPALPPYAQETLIDWIRQDVTSAQMPVAPILATPLLDAVGILNPAPRLVVLPNHPALGEFREEFAGMFGTFERHPSEIEEGVGGFAGSVEVKSTEGMLDDVEDDPHNRIDTRAYLTARLVDILIGDWDRHEGQWRWARYDRGETRWWVPVPEDRDYAFVKYEGALLSLARLSGLSRLVSFGEEYSSLDAMMANSLDLNRRLLSEIPESTWDSVAIFVQERITDNVIAAAMQQAPPELRGPEIESIETALRKRRDALPEMARDYYLLMAEMVEVHSTDADEVAEINRHADGSLDISISTTEGLPVYHRLFLPDQTREVRLDLHGGSDRAVVRGASDSVHIVLRVLGGGDSDYLEDLSAGPTIFYDSSGENTLLPGPNTRIDRRGYAPPADSASLLPSSDLDWGRSFSVAPKAEWRSHVGIVLGAQASWTRYGFRADPYLTRHRVGGVVDPTSGRVALEYKVELRRENSDRWLEVWTEVSTMNAVRFHGLGNASEDAGEDSKVWLTELTVSPTWHHPLSEQLTLLIGPVLKYTKSDVPGGSPAGEADVIGRSFQGQLQAHLSLEHDSRDSRWFPRRGATAVLSGLSSRSIVGTDFTFARLEAEGSFYRTLPLWNDPVLALRSGATHIWGEFPFQEAAFLGGSGSLRGFQRERFAGSSMIFGGAELRVPLTTVEIIARGDLGVSGLLDTGRVFVSGDSEGGWHRSAGGSLWFATPVLSTSLTFAHGDSNRLYLDIGLPF